ncbi:MAG: retropepsin-like aspartic protease family protein [Planctomycetota bacterium]
MSVSFPFTRGRLIVAPVRVRHVHVREPVMALDTGARISVITPRIALDLGFDAEAVRSSVVITSATGQASAAQVSINSVAILGLEVRDVKALCYPLPSSLQLDGILGLNFLRHFDIEISHTNETVTMERRRE